MEQENSIEANKFSTRFGEWVVRFRYLVIAITVAVVCVAASGGIFLKLNTDFRIFFSKDNPELQAFELLENTYEKVDNVLVMIVPDDGDATSENALEAAVWLTDRMWHTPYSSRVDSIANFQTMMAEGDDLIVRDLVDPNKLDDAQQRQTIRTDALSDPRLAGNLLATDGAVSAVNTMVKLPEQNSAAAIAEVANFTRDVVAQASEQFEGIDFRPVGIVMINQSFVEATWANASTVLPLSIAIMAAILGFLTRGFAGIAMTGAVIFLSVSAALGLAGWIGIPFSTTTSITPTILLTLVIANCLHVLITVQQHLGAGNHKRVAAVRSIELNLMPIFLANVTTAFGFLMMNFSEVPPYRHLGTLVAIGTAVSFVLSVTLLPALLSLISMRPLRPGKSRFGMESFGEFVIRHKNVLLWVSIAVIVGLVSAVPRNELNDVLTHYFDEDTQIRQDSEFLDERLSGNSVIEYSIESGEPGGITDPAFLQDISAFAEWYRMQPETRHVFVISDTIRELNKQLQGGEADAYRIPETRDLASQLLLLYEMSLPLGLDVNNRINLSKSATRMTVTTQTLSSDALLELDARAKSWVVSNTQNFSEFQSSGFSLMFAHIGHRNIRAMITGTVIAFLGVSLILIFAFRSLRIGLVSLLSNFVPGFMAFGVWGLVVGEVGIALSVVMAMTIGIVVDDTVHFLSKYLHAKRELALDSQDAVRYAFRTVGRALYATTVILVAGFLFLGMSDFFPASQMGRLTSIMIMLALVVDFLFLPPLLMLIDRKRAG